MFKDKGKVLLKINIKNSIYKELETKYNIIEEMYK